jgi:nicotinamide-nucleotide adenylyltransferase
MRGLVLGRFQPLHHGHVALIRHGLERCGSVVVAIGSSTEPPSLRNPFTARERRQMVEAAFPREVAAGLVTLVDVPDLHDPPHYAKHALSLTGPVDAVFGNDESTLDLFAAEGLRVEQPGFLDRATHEAKAIRALLAADDIAWRKRVPPAVAMLLMRWDAGKRLRGLEAYA